MSQSYDLDLATPEEVPTILEAIANQYRESASELAGAWQDRNAGKVWADFATILDRAAESCRKAISKRLG
jgi:acyl-CoA reductase-like NAD-dependent aldehyde dehydrogenase